MEEGFALWANPSSPHAEGRKAKQALEDARDRIKAALGLGQGDRNYELIFTSGASEALWIALNRAKANRRIVSAVEHDAVFRAAPDAEISSDESLFDAQTILAVQHVNSETGVINPVDQMAEALRETGAVMLSDCAQSAGKIELPDADMLVVSAHKFGGPIGIGALLVRDWAMLEPVGGQERGYRAGTENLPGVLAMVSALEAGSDWVGEALRLRNRLEAGIVDAGGEVIAADATRSPTIGGYRMPGKSSAAQLIRFDAMGIAVSAGSACSSGSLRTSHVLSAMGLDDKAASEVIRVSIGRETCEADIDRFLAAWREIAGKRAAA